jgi:hypothetical protein
MRLTGRRLLRFNTVHLWLWIGPGAIINYLLRDKLWWTNLMSWFAIVLTVGTMWATSRTEKKQDDDTGD